MGHLWKATFKLNNFFFINSWWKYLLFLLNRYDAMVQVLLFYLSFLFNDFL